MSDAQRDEQPRSKSIFVNDDKLRIFYKFWPALPYKQKCKFFCTPPNLFCFGPSPRIKKPKKSSIVLLGGWGNMKEDYDKMAYLLSQCQRNVVTLDYRGIGETGLGSDKFEGFWTSEQYAKDVMDLIESIFVPTPTATKQEKVFIVGLGMGANVALQCALSQKSEQYLRGIAVCSGHGGSYLLKKGKYFDEYGEQILSGNALHYGYCEAQKIYIERSHSATYQKSKMNMCKLYLFYSWQLSTYPLFCCNKSKKILNVRKQSREHRLNGFEEPNFGNRKRGISKWFESKLSLQIGGANKHRIVEGIERQIDIAEGHPVGYDIANKLGKMRINTLIYCGSEDEIIDYESAERLKSSIGGVYASMEVMDGGGHNFWFERPNEFIQTIQEWMQFEEECDRVN